MRICLRALTPVIFASAFSAFLPSANAEVSAPKSQEDRALKCEERAEMGTPFKICVFEKPSEHLATGFDLRRAFDKIRQMNGWMSDWQEGTQLSQVNGAAGAHPVKVGPELFKLLKYTMRVSEKTNGAFDPTFNAFWGLYDFKKGHEREATDAEIKERLPLIDWHSVVLDEKAQTVYLKKPGMKLGLGGLGQGYAVDQVVADLKAKYPAGYVDGSGDTYFWGRKPDGSMWTTGIRDPRDPAKIVLRVYGTDFGVTTSGDDEKFFMKDGRRVHHILDPKTGRPSTASRQVTVIAKRALDADAFDTGAFVLGPEKGRAVIEAIGSRAVFVTDQGVTMTKGLVKKQTPWGEVYEVQGELREF